MCPAVWSRLRRLFRYSPSRTNSIADATADGSFDDSIRAIISPMFAICGSLSA